MTDRRGHDLLPRSESWVKPYQTSSRLGRLKHRKRKSLEGGGDGSDGGGGSGDANGDGGGGGGIRPAACSAQCAVAAVSQYTPSIIVIDGFGHGTGLRCLASCLDRTGYCRKQCDKTPGDSPALQYAPAKKRKFRDPANDAHVPHGARRVGTRTFAPARFSTIVTARLPILADPYFREPPPIYPSCSSPRPNTHSIHT